MAWTVSPTVVWLDSAGEVQLYDTEAGQFQTLNETGAAIWRRMVECGDQEAIVAALAADFGAQDDHQRGIIAADTGRFLRDLAGRGLIREESGVAG